MCETRFLTKGQNQYFTIYRERNTFIAYYSLGDRYKCDASKDSQLSE